MGKTYERPDGLLPPRNSRTGEEEAAREEAQEAWARKHWFKVRWRREMFAFKLWRRDGGPLDALFWVGLVAVLLLVNFLLPFWIAVGVFVAILAFMILAGLRELRESRELDPHD